ncbi:FAST kinase domain-containing protein 3, mitochondrial [Battus philenor]|uniref:FAST kinase domain-containing protein 3, mitochondrial n=1 Tax=Battus philenor TaxID=42288 RepID=UPI0035D10CCC
MSLVLRRSYTKFRNNVPISSNSNCLSSTLLIVNNRCFSDDKLNNYYYSKSTILIENGYKVQELPIVIRKVKTLSEKMPKVEPKHNSNNSLNYHLIQAEFKQCKDLRDVFSLITKCTKITPNIALGAIERIYDLEKNPQHINFDLKLNHTSIAKGAILDKLLKVLMQTEDTCTILNILKTESSLIEPHKHKFCDELLDRVIDNKLTLEQLCEFTRYLINNNDDSKCSETIDKLWVGFIEKEHEINENNIEVLFKILPGLKSSKRTILVLLEQKLSDMWYKIKLTSMQEILGIFIEVKYFSLQSFAILGCWFSRNIHSLDEDAVLDIITKFIHLNYTDCQVEKAVEKYMKHKSTKIKSYVLIVAILNYCLQFQIRNENILNVCNQFTIKNINDIPASFLKCLIYPYGYLNFHPKPNEFWIIVESILIEKFDKISVSDLSSITLSFIFCGKHPFKLVNKIFTSENVAKICNQDVMKRLQLIDTALSLEASEYPGPLLPKDHWLRPLTQDSRVEAILEKLSDIFTCIVKDPMKITNAVLIPNFCSDQTYLIDVLMHPSDFGRNLHNWKAKSLKNNVTAILVHLPDHYCSDNKTLIGPQVLKIKHLRMLGMKVVSLKYFQLSQLYTLHDKPGLKKYIQGCIDNALPCL